MSHSNIDNKIKEIVNEYKNSFATGALAYVLFGRYLRGMKSTYNFHFAYFNDRGMHMILDPAWSSGYYGTEGLAVICLDEESDLLTNIVDNFLEVALNDSNEDKEALLSYLIEEKENDYDITPDGLLKFKEG